MAKVTLEFHCVTNTDADDMHRKLIDFVRECLPTAANARLEVVDFEVGKKIHPAVCLTVTTRVNPKPGDLGVVVT